MCGEKCSCRKHSHRPVGSPPRVRGKGIPADLFRTAPEDHPRVCGEKGMAVLDTMASLGSPPRVRGKEMALYWIPSVCGITPACAGKSTEITINRLKYIGSPPRVRGKEAYLEKVGEVNGITPACAGKSLKSLSSSVPMKDHPRVCGEKGIVFIFACLTLGSPPRVRGKVLLPEALTQARRITPACAGKSKNGVDFWSTTWDHPRVCGEKSVNNLLL